jgi:polysaccharide export outer membrane protein
MILVVWICLSSTTAWASWDAYLIGAGDLLEVSVWKVPDLSKQLSVLPDGKIAFPLIGEVQAAGKTVEQLKKKIEVRLAPFVPDPMLTVVVLQVNSLVVYVIGRVNQPGRFLLNAKIDVLQALAMAGGLDNFAKRGDIRILRKSGGGKKIFQFDYDKVSTGRNMAQNIVLKRGDVVMVR